MANNKEPEGLDDFLTDQDPQAARASQGVNKLAAAAFDSGPQTMDSIEPESSPVDALILGAAAPLTGKIAQGAERIVGNEIGALGLDINQNEITDHALGLLQKTQAAFKAGKASQKELAFAQQKFATAQRLAQRNGKIAPTSYAEAPRTGDALLAATKIKPDTYASGGIMYADGGAMYAEGGQVAEPDGLDAFLAGTAPTVTAAPVQDPSIVGTPNAPTFQSPTISPSSEPAGLDAFIAPEVHEAELQDNYGTTGQQILTGAEGLAQGVAGPLATAAELALGIKPEDIRAREEANPYISDAGKIVGLGGSMLTGAGEGALLLRAGEAASHLVKGAGLAAKVGAAAADGAIQNMLLAGGDEITKQLRSDPDASMQSAVANIGLSGLLGGSIGGALGTVSPLWKSTFGDHAGQVVEDFKNRIDQHINNPDPASAVAKELAEHWESTNMVADPVYGHNGLKAQEIANAMPEFHNGMTEQATRLTQKLDDSINAMNAKPNKYPPRFADKLNDVATDLKLGLSKAESPADIFNSVQNAKQTLQTFAKFDKLVTPVDEGHGFVQMAKSLQHDFRTSLEDSGVWGKAAKAQQDINSAATDFFKASKDFQSKFTTKVQGEPVIDPGKINTYVNQLGKPNAEIKSTVLKNYLDAAETYRKKISDIHANLGLTNPVTPTSLNSTMQTFDKPTTGSKLADVFIEKGLTQAGGKGIGAAIGAVAGSKVHVPGAELLGTMLGAHILGPFISSILPLIAKPVLNAASNALALKSASDAGYAMIRGTGLVDRATKALFTSGKDVLPVSMIPSANKLARLDHMVLAANEDPNSISEGPTNISGYMPQHGQAAAMVGGAAVNYLKSLRPNTDKKAPLDPTPVPSRLAMAQYNRQLANAEQPLMVLNRVKNGTVTSQDLLTLQTIYPDLYKAMAAKILDQMTDHLTKGKTIPYQTRIGLSKLAAQPLDSSMTPSSIMAAQPQPQMPQPPGEQPGKGKARKGAGGTALNKLSGAYQTQSQALATRHQKD